MHKPGSSLNGPALILGIEDKKHCVCVYSKSVLDKTHSLRACLELNLDVGSVADLSENNG